MKPHGAVNIRRFRAGEGAALFGVFHTAVHRIAARDYTPEQVQAWAPDAVDPALWEERMAALDPFVAELPGEIVGYADLQADGYIDHFYVSGFHPRRGIGDALMQRILAEAQARGIAQLSSDVSLTAQPFFARHGFEITGQRMSVVRGVAMPNARMRKVLA